MNKQLLLSISILLLSSLSTKSMHEEFDTSQYHMENAEFVKWFDEKHPRTEKFYSLVMPEETYQPPVTQVLLKRKDGLGIEGCIEEIRKFDFKKSQKKDAPNGTRDAARHTRFLELVNQQFKIEQQILLQDGNLLTTFEAEVPYDKLVLLYKQVPGIEAVEKVDHQ